MASPFPPTNQTPNQPIIQPSNQPTDQITLQPIHAPTKHLTKQPQPQLDHLGAPLAVV